MLPRGEPGYRCRLNGAIVERSIDKCLTFGAQFWREFDPQRVVYVACIGLWLMFVFTRKHVFANRVLENGVIVLKISFCVNAENTSPIIKYGFTCKIIRHCPWANCCSFSC